MARNAKRRGTSAPHPWRPPPWLVVLAAAVVVTWILVRFVVWVGDRIDPFADETTQEGVQRLLAENPAPRQELAPPDPAAVLAVLAARFPAEMTAARAAHVRPAPADGAHGLYAAYLSALHAIDPRLVPDHDGVHRHLPPVPLIDKVAWLRSHLLMRDVLAALDTLPEATAPHEVTDREILRANVLDIAVHHVGSDADVLRTVNAWFDPLFMLAAFDCCDVDERAAVAAEHLSRTAVELQNAVNELTRPPRPLVLAVADRCEDAAAYLADYADAWPDRVAARLEEPARTAATAAARVARRLREEIAPRAGLRLGSGRNVVARRLRLVHRLDATPEQLLRVALRVAESEPDYLHDDDTPEAGAPRPAAEILAELRTATATTIAPVGEDSGVRLAALPRLWARDFGGAFHVAAPRDELPDLVLLAEPDDDPDQDDWARTSAYLDLRHTVAHETYPGHHVADEAMERVCRLRRDLADGFTFEGWPAYCEELVHELGACDGSAADDWMLYSGRIWNAQLAVCVLAMEMGLADHHDLQHWVGTSWGVSWTEADVGRISLYGLYAAGYLFGRIEIEAFREEEERRRRGHFDLARFHRGILEAGPIPIPLLRREQEAERRR